MFCASKIEPQISAKLIYAPDESTIWSEEFERELDMEDLLAVVNKVTDTIADGLHAIISPEVKRRIAVVPTGQIEAYDLYNRAQNYQYAYDFGLDDRDLDNAESLYREALKLDSTFALAYAGLGFVNLSRTGFIGQRSIHESQYIDSARHFALRALRFDNDNADAYYLRGYYYAHIGELNKAIADQTKAVSLDPHLVEAYLALGELNRNDPQEAIINIKKGLSLEKDGSLTPSLLAALGNIYFDIGAVDRAEEYFRESVLLQPDYFYGFDRLWALSIARGQFEEALEISDALCVLDDRQCLYSAEMGHFFAGNFDSALVYHDRNDEFMRRRGRRVGPTLNGIFIQMEFGNEDKARELLRKYVVFMEGRQGKNKHLNLAQAYASIGDVRKALIHLKQHEFRNWGRKSYAFHNPAFKSLRDNEEFNDLFAKIEEEIAEIRGRILTLEAAGKL